MKHPIGGFKTFRCTKPIYKGEGFNHYQRYNQACKTQRFYNYVKAMESYTHLTRSWDQLSMDGSMSRMQQAELEPVDVKKLVAAFGSH